MGIVKYCKQVLKYQTKEHAHQVIAEQQSMYSGQLILHSFPTTKISDGTSSSNIHGD